MSLGYLTAGTSLRRRDLRLYQWMCHETGQSCGTQDNRVVSYVKNDHLFLEIPYRFGGRTLRYIPDFVVDLGDRRYLLLESKGREDAKAQAKHSAAQRWVSAVNSDGRWGRWAHRVVYAEQEVRPALEVLAVAS